MMTRAAITYTKEEGFALELPEIDDEETVDVEILILAGIFSRLDVIGRDIMASIWDREKYDPRLPTKRAAQ